MQAIIFCRTEAKGKHTFYIRTEEGTFFLFQQDYRASTNEYFKNGVSIAEINNYSAARGAAVRKTLDKLPVFIRYIEKEYGIAVYEKTRSKRQTKVRNGKLAGVRLF